MPNGSSVALTATDGLLNEAIRGSGYEIIGFSGRREPFSRRDGQEGRG
jgi:hypothetical protein